MHEDENIKSLIEIHKPYFRLLDDGKVQCILNNHAFPPNKDVIEAFIRLVSFHGVVVYSVERLLIFFSLC